MNQAFASFANFFVGSTETVKLSISIKESLKEFRAKRKEEAAKSVEAAAKNTEKFVAGEAARRRKKGRNSHNESAGWSLNEMSRAQNVLIISVIVLFAVAAVFIHR